MKGCTLQCEWCSNPEAVSLHPQILFNHRLCVHCGECIPACPTHAFSMNNDSLHFDRSLCNACGRCIQCCPEGVLELVGRELSADVVVDEVLRDRVFYQVSGGGVTFSGGEPLLQPDFVCEIANELREQNVHVAIDTAGNVPWRSFEMVLPFTDLILYDIKFIDPVTHKRFTGVDNQLLLENALRIAEHGTPMIVRLVILPGLNDTEEEINSRLGFIEELAIVEQVDLLPYHKLGAAKYERLGKLYQQPNLIAPGQEEMRSLSQIFHDKGYKVTVGG